MDKDAYIGLGSNQGDRELNLLRAVAEIGKLPDSRVSGLSPFYETSPVGVANQPDFINAVLRLSTRLTPLALLLRLQHIECVVFRRTRTQHWGPRTMDLDLLLYADLVLNAEELTVPHPRMTDRRFVLEPLCTLAPGLRHPVLGRTMAELLAALPATEKIVQI